MSTSLNQKPRVCYFRGSYLNPFETQYLEPLQDQYDLFVAHMRSHRYDVNSIPIPRRSVHCLDYLNGLIPRRINGHVIPNPLKYFGYDEVIFGVDRLLSGVDLVHMPEQTFYSSSQIARRKSALGFKIITVQDEINPYWYAYRSVVKVRTDFVRSQTDLFIARTKRANAALLCEGVPAEKIDVVGHGVDTNRFKPGEKNTELANRLGIDSDRFVILFVGNLLWTKGIFSIANSAKLLLMDSKFKKMNPLFVMVGQGDDRSKLEERIRLFGLEDQFLLTGNLPYHTLPDVHRLADIFVLPSISTRYILEQFGIVLIEAMATGTSVISTHCGAIDEVVSDSGLLVQPNDFYRLHEALARLILDETLRKELGQRGLARVRSHFSHEVISSKLRSAYQKVLDR